jgi:LCP family protein required for cell wall assembly
VPDDAPGGEPRPGPGGSSPQGSGGQPRQKPEGRPDYNVYSSEPRPDYKVYRSRPRLLDRLRPSGTSPLEALRRRRPAPSVEPGGPPRRRRPRLRRVLKWAAIVVGSWILLSIAVFLISAQTAPGVSGDGEKALSSGGSLFTGSNILVLGSDQRPKGSREPGATTSGPSRSDSIIVLHVGFGTVRKLAILRDSYVPGLGKINAAFAQGGTGGAIRTVERFMGNGLRINHVILVSFTNFPKLIDALGGVDITLDNCVKSQRFGGKRVALNKGDHHLTGREALRFARVRKNRCAPNEDDRARSARQQQILAAMRDRLVSPLHWPSTLVRLPLISWEAPRALRTDMKGPGLMTLFTDLLTGGTGATRVLKPSGLGPGGSLVVSDSERSRAVRALLGK